MNRTYRYPGWETALSWFHRPRRVGRKGRYWLTPPDLYQKLDEEFGFDFDPCPCPLPKDFNGLSTEWGQSNFVNPPFSKDDVIGGAGATAFVRKAISEHQNGERDLGKRLRGGAVGVPGGEWWIGIALKAQLD
jgi:hypothetical protein